jgi:hypothetical protein
MAGKGPAPKAPAVRRNKSAPSRGEIATSASSGWQHGKTPKTPEGLRPASAEAWKVWMGAWFAAFWSPDDLPGLRQVVRLYDEVERGEFQRAGELRLQMDTYGITPKGQQDRRWAKPKTDEPMQPTGKPPSSRYAHLKVV